MMRAAFGVIQSGVAAAALHRPHGKDRRSLKNSHQKILDYGADFAVLCAHSMKNEFLNYIGLAVMAGITLITPALASVSISYVAVGNPGNAADTTGYGAVGYSYNIGAYDVTNTQYAAMLNAVASTDTNGLYNSGMASYGITQNGSSGGYTYSVTGSMANNPVVDVSWFDAARFCNWLQNGQPTGAENAATTETGAYTLNGATTGIIQASANATVRLPTENEWYKAAYYNGTTGTYTQYATQSNSITTAQANFNNAVGTTTPVGSYGIASYYGTYDQTGNVWNWNDAVISGASRGLRGGSWRDSQYYQASSCRTTNGPFDEWGYIGFRVASTVPEPSAAVLALLAGAAVLAVRKR